MHRDYIDRKSDSVGVFSGKEVEHTPAFGKQTLFIARNDLYFDTIVELAQETKAEAIYFGANRTFMPNHGTQPNQIRRLLRKGYWVTIDYPHNEHQRVKENYKDVWNEEKFIPFCSIIFPKGEDDDNLCIKVDDVDFDSTNPGVWTMSMNHFKQSAGFTSWKDYKQDKPLEEKKIWQTQSK
jgi:hypothetical protein